MTTLGGRDLYPDVLTRVASGRNPRRHPDERRRKVRFGVAGVLPDATGPGQPDILPAKRVAR